MTERPIDQIKKAEEAMRELVTAAAELRRQIAFACAEHPKETAELVHAAESFEREVQTIKERLQQWRQGIQKVLLITLLIRCLSTRGTRTMRALPCLQLRRML